MSGSAAVSAAKNRRTRETNQQGQEQRTKNVQFYQEEQEPRQELTFIQALHTHDFRLRRNEELIKQLVNANTNTNANANANAEVKDTFDLFNERITSIEKYIDEELSNSLSLKEKEDKEGEDVIYEKITVLETLLKDMKTELLRMQNASRDTNVSFLKYKKDTDGQLKEMKDAIKSLVDSTHKSETKVDEVNNVDDVKEELNTVL